MATRAAIALAALLVLAAPGAGGNGLASAFGTGGPIHRGDSYALEPGSDPSLLPTCRFTEEEVSLLIDKRLEYRKRRRFGDADRILEALNANGIYLQDRARLYRVDGASHFGRRQRAPYARRGPAPGLGREDLAEIRDRVEDRDRAKGRKDYAAADAIAEGLRLGYGVRIDDKRREWSVSAEGTGSGGEQAANAPGKGELYVPTPLVPPDHPTHTMARDLREYVRDRLRERSLARGRRDYGEADRIRDELMEEHAVLIDDRTREWMVVVQGESGGGGSDPFAEGARLSQRSAFVRSSSREPSRPRRGGSDSYQDSYDESYSESYNDRYSESNDDWEPVADLPEVPGGREATRRDARDREPGATSAAAAPVAPATEGTAPTAAPDHKLVALTVPLLKEKLRAEGLKVSGRKADLIDRLVSAGILE